MHADFCGFASVLGYGHIMLLVLTITNLEGPTIEGVVAVPMWIEISLHYECFFN